MSLILHCGAHAIDRSELELLPEPQPLGPRHQPVHHADFIRQVESSLHDHGYDLTETAFGVTNNGARLFGVATVEHALARGFAGGSYTIGFRASHDQTLPCGLAAGTRVFVCDNLAFTGESVLSTKQTTHIRGRLPTLVEDMVQRLAIFFERAGRQVEAYRGVQVLDQVADAAITEMGRRGIINWGELGKVVAEWDEPKHEEHVEGGRNVWRLFNAATEVMKPRNPDHPRLPHLAPKTVELHRICDELAGLPLAA